MTESIDLLPYVETLAPACATKVGLAEQINAALGLEWTMGKWRGIWKDQPRLTATAEKLLGRALVVAAQDKIQIDGDVRGVILGDSHCPFHDQNAVDLAAKVVKWWQPDVLIWNGDEVDFYLLSRFDKHPGRKHTTQDEIDRWHIDVHAPIASGLRKGAKQLMTYSNHIDRLWRMICANPGLYGLRNVEITALLELDRLGICMAKQYIRFGNLLEVKHGNYVAAGSGKSIEKELRARRYAISMAMNHIHRSGYVKAQRLERDYVQGWEVPCLCCLEPEYRPDSDWNQGIGLFETRGPKLYFDVVEFYQDYTCAVGKQWFGLD